MRLDPVARLSSLLLAALGGSSPGARSLCEWPTADGVDGVPFSARRKGATAGGDRVSMHSFDGRSSGVRAEMEQSEQLCGELHLIWMLRVVGKEV